MGVLPLQFMDGENARVARPEGRRDVSTSPACDDGAVADRRRSSPRGRTAAKSRSRCKVLLLTPKEVEYFRHGGILHYVLRQLAARKAA